MATMAGLARPVRRAETFWLASAITTTAIIVAGFSLNLAMGRSSFGEPLVVHLHALVFFGWTALYLVQNIFADSPHMALHRRLGWLAVVLVPAMVAMGTIVTVRNVRLGHVPFFFQPAYFLVMNPLGILFFAGLVAAAILQRRHTQWHRRLMLCAMAMLTGPAFGRLLPLPLVIPYAGWTVFGVTLLFPLAGVVRDLRRGGRVHPAWTWGLGTMLAYKLATAMILASPLGVALYDAATRGSPGADVPPLAYPDLPTFLRRIAPHA